MNPFVKEGLATLGSCVPLVRRSALPGDWLLIFKRQSGGLRFLLRLHASRTYAGYMREGNRRGDAIYTRCGVGYQRRNTLFSAEHLTEKEQLTDVDGANVLQSRLFRVWEAGTGGEGLPNGAALPEALAGLQPTGCRGPTYSLEEEGGYQECHWKGADGQKLE